jgi:hypothetical protein
VVIHREDAILAVVVEGGEPMSGDIDPRFAAEVDSMRKAAGPDNLRPAAPSMNT